MKVLGLIVEYNPFHNGHLYHLEQSKNLCKADYVICVMSGNFIQRGEPAIVNKWARAKMALMSGIDLVIEIPTAYAMASAEYFAFGGTKLLDSLGIVDSICFGSEIGKLSELDLIAEILVNEPPEYRTILKESLSKGVSYPSARSAALYHYLETQLEFNGNFNEIINSSNNILGIEYLKALKKLKSTITPYTIPRIKNSYNSIQLSGNISSATAIRESILSNTKQPDYIKALEGSLPNSSISVLNEEFELGRGPVSVHDYSDIILSSIRRLSLEQIKDMPYVSEGLENRIKSASETSGNLQELIEKICTKRYTRTRIQRTLLNILTGITAKDFEAFNKFGGPQYIRVLGFNEGGRYLLSQINKRSTLPVVIKTADFKGSCNPLLKRMLEIESFATDMYVLCHKNTIFKKSGQEFTQNIIRINT